MVSSETWISLQSREDSMRVRDVEQRHVHASTSTLVCTTLLSMSAGQ